MELALAPASARDLPNASAPIAAGLRNGFASQEECLSTIEAAFAEFERIERPSTWGTFWATDVASGEPVGLCGFKDRPNDHGTVEIAYLTFPLLRGRGFATAMARLLLQHAKNFGSMKVLAHTLPAESASTTVLNRLGFVCDGEIIDPDDGPVWRWQLG